MGEERRMLEIPRNVFTNIVEIAQWTFSQIDHVSIDG